MDDVGMRYLQVLLEGTEELRSDFGLRVGMEEVEWYGPSVRLLGDHCAVEVHADVRDGVIDLHLMPLGAEHPYLGNGLALRSLVEGSGRPEAQAEIREVDRLSGIGQPLFRSPDYDMHTAQLRLLCRLLAKHGHRYLMGVEPLPAKGPKPPPQPS